MPPPPPHPRHRIWSPVQHAAADSLLLVLIASFAATVLLVRLYLELTGFPQVVDLVTFYFNQFYTVGSALFQLSLLGAVEWYRWRLERHSDHHAAHHAVETADAA